jgi:hypothetical protein
MMVAGVCTACEVGYVGMKVSGKTRSCTPWASPLDGLDHFLRRAVAVEEDGVSCTQRHGRYVGCPRLPPT